MDNSKYRLEQIRWFKHWCFGRIVQAYKRQGLFSVHNMPFNGVSFYQSQLSLFGVPHPTYPSRFSWIYKVPRRW
ncbi:hypothetical protein [Natronoflexus pectinivorans]|uniref:hypothetical protein n=1 Tax=Natronoflexus pectinivorans TaxID=682526 RepID=UPI00104314A5|nr:hypothetical protein [Natronoflexus pectinivorans]